MTQETIREAANTHTRSPRCPTLPLSMELSAPMVPPAYLEQAPGLDWDKLHVENAFLTLTAYNSPEHAAIHALIETAQKNVRNFGRSFDRLAFTTDKVDAVGTFVVTIYGYGSKKLEGDPLSTGWEATPINLSSGAKGLAERTVDEVITDAKREEPGFYYGYTTGPGVLPHGVTVYRKKCFVSSSVVHGIQ